MNKEELSRTFVVLLLTLVMFEGLLIALGVDVIKDLTDTVNYTKTDAERCYMELNSIKNDYEQEVGK